MIRLKRIYDEPSPDDGVRVLVDRLWPRGISKEVAAIDDWDRDIAPSPALRKAFCHNPEHWDEFRHGYLAELERNTVQTTRLLEIAHQGTLTLLYAAKDTVYYHAVVLKEYLEGRL